MSATVDDMIAALQKLQHQGHGKKMVFYRHGASGDCGPLGSPCLTDEVDDETGPFDLEPGQQYVSIYAGN